MTTKAQREKAIEEFKQTQDIVLVQKLLGHKHLRSTLNLIVRAGAFRFSVKEQK